MRNRPALAATAALLAALIFAPAMAQDQKAGEPRPATEVKDDFFVRMGQSMKSFSDETFKEEFMPGKTITCGKLTATYSPSGEELKTFTGHGRPVTCAAFSPDGKTLATGSEDGTLKLWDMKKGGEIKAFLGHREPVQCIAFSDDGKTLASGSNDRTFRIWDVKKGKETRSNITASNRALVSSILFNPKGNVVFTGTADRALKSWDADSGKETGSVGAHSDIITQLILIRDGKVVVSSSRDRLLKAWDPVKLAEIKTFTGHAGPVFSVAASPDGKTLYSGSEDRTVRVWNFDQGAEVRQIKMAAPVRSVAVSADGKILAITQDRTIKLYSTETFLELRTLSGHNENIQYLAFSPDGSTLASTGRDSTARAWDAELCVEIKGPSGSKFVTRAASLSLDKLRIAAAMRDNSIKVFDCATGAEIKSVSPHTGDVYLVELSPDASVVATAGLDKTVKVWEYESSKPPRSFSETGDKVNSISFSPIEKTIAVCRSEKSVKLLDWDKGKLIKLLEGHSDSVLASAYSRDGKTLVTSGKDKTLRVWDVDAGALTGSVTLDKEGPVRLAFNRRNDGLLGAIGGDGTSMAFAVSGRENLDMTGGKPYAPPFPEMLVERVSPEQIKAGEIARFRVTIDNSKGKGDLFQFCVFLECPDEPSFDKRVFLFGKVEAGRTASKDVSLYTEYNWKNRKINVKFHTAELNRNAAKDAEGSFSVLAPAMPDFQIDLPSTKDGQGGVGVGNGNGIVERGEAPEISISIRNSGQLESGIVTVEIADFPADDNLVFFGEKKSELGRLAIGEQKNFTFSIQIKAPYKGDMIYYTVRIREDKYGIEHSSHIGIGVK